MIRTFIIASLLLLLQACKPTDDQQQDRYTNAEPAIQTIDKDGCQVRYAHPPKETALVDAFVIPIDVTASQKATLDVDTSALDEHFTVATRMDSPQSTPEQPFSQHLDITVEPNWHGTYELGEILLSFSFDEKAPVIIPIPKHSLTVREPSAEEQALKPDDQAARTPLPPTPKPTYTILYITLAVLAVLCLLGLAIVLIRRFRRSRSRVSLPPPIPAHLRALRALDALLAQNLLQQGQIKPFYDRLSEIVRDYIEDRFGLRAPEMTTEEFLLSLRTQAPNALSPKHSQLIDNFMNHTDLVKYARQIPCLDEINQTVQAARSFIQETIPIPAEPQEHHA